MATHLVEGLLKEPISIPYMRMAEQPLYIQVYLIGETILLKTITTVAHDEASNQDAETNYPILSVISALENDANWKTCKRSKKESAKLVPGIWTSPDKLTTFRNEHKTMEHQLNPCGLL